MLKRKVSLHDILVYSISKDKLMLHECFDYVDTKDENWRWHFYQMPIKCDDIVCCCSGRGIGKTSILDRKILHHMINYKNSSCLLTTLDQGHIVPRINKIFSYFMSYIPYKWFMTPDKRRDGAIKRNIPAYLKLLNGYEFWATIAGKNTEADNLRQFHVDMTVIEEAQMWTNTAEKVAKKTRNPFSAKHGSSINWFGTNNGRVDTPFYDKNNSDPFYEKHRYTVASWCNPSYTLKTHIEDLREYGNIDSATFKQEIRGLQGDFDEGIFSPHDYNDCCLTLQGVYSKYRYDANLLARSELRNWIKFEEHKDFIIDSEDVWFSADIGGKGTPTEIIIWCLKENRWWVISNITLVDMDANIQAQFIDRLTELYNPSYIAIDCTGLESALVSILKNPKLYSSLKRYSERIVEVYFSKKMIIGYETDEKGNVIFDKNGNCIPVYANTFNFSLDLIKQKMRERMFIFPEEDGSLKKEILGYKRQGNVFKGKNHKIQSIQCFVICWWLKKSETLVMQKRYNVSLSFTELF